MQLSRPKLRGTTEAFASRLFGSHVTKTNALESLVIASFVRGLTMTPDGLQLLQDLRRSLLDPPRQLRTHSVTATGTTTASRTSLPSPNVTMNRNRAVTFTPDSDATSEGGSA